MIYKKYAKYYDSLYTDKNYTKECDDIYDLIKKHLVADTINMVDLGCGSGTHATIFHKLGINVIGIDQSEEMIKLAKEKNPEGRFIIDDITTAKLVEKANVAVSLFHVVSYLTTDEQLNNFLDRVRDNIETDGLLIFDVWIGNGVLTDPPSKRTKKIDDDTIRIATPTVDYDNQIVDVEYVIGDTTELHQMRYFFPREIKYILKEKGFKLISQTPVVDKDTWAMLLVCKKK